MTDAIPDVETATDEELGKIIDDLTSGKDKEADEADEAKVPAEEENAEAEKEPDKETEPDGVLTRNGRHVIPYDVLRRTRDAAQQATHEKEQALQRLAELETTQAKGQDKPGDAAGQQSKLKEIEDAFPELGEVIRPLMENVSAMQAKVAEFERERAMNVIGSVQEAIDENQTLSHWQHNDPGAWERAKGFDDVLKQDPEWAGKSFGDRFTKVVELTKAAYPRASVPPRHESATELEAKAGAAVRNAGNRPPTTLSDIPGGSSPHGKEAGNLSNQQLEAMFENMDDDKLQEYLAKFG